jgi:hypothetical protein
MSDVRSANFVAPPGGVMTDEVGTVTGDLTLRSELADGGTVRVLVQYLGADEWYRVTDSPEALPAGSTLDDLHATMLAKLSGAAIDPEQGRANGDGPQPPSG